ncbi:MAG TPA: glycosyltransferase [Ornithinibacter sp.]|nr:glycosyltransferase [Ornithinibacter sp.]
MDAKRLRQVKRAMDGRGGAPLRSAYRVATAGALVAVKAVDRLSAGRGDPEERAESALTVTMAVKTFKRPEVARRLVRSARTVFDGRIVVADDSPAPMSFDDPLVDVIAMPFNSGVSVGRNAALDAVDTEFVLVTDDDLVFTAATDVDAARRRLQTCPDIDVVGFVRVELPRWMAHDFGPDSLFRGHREPLRPWGQLVGGLPVRLKIEQTYLARTEAIRRVRWDPQIRMVDHADFFSRASGEIVVVLDPAIRAYHARTPFDPEYTRYRLDVSPDQAYLGRVWRQRAAAQARGEEPDMSVRSGPSPG